mgnify:CR=1 FL=1
MVATCVCIASLIIRKKQKQIRSHENPAVQGVNRLDSHVVCAAFSSEKESRSHVMQRKCSINALDLSGKWHFRLFRNANDAFYFKEHGDRRMRAEGGTEIVVPGSWQLQCVGDMPIYTNSGYVCPLENIEIPCDNPTGYYTKEFVVRSSWSSRRIVLHFGGVDSAFYVWVNDQYIGFSKDSRLPVEFDITSAVKFNTSDNTLNIGGSAAVNSLEVLVCRMSDGAIFENQDMWNLSGIYRDVMLISYPQPLHIWDFSWSLDLEFFTSAYSATHGEEGRDSWLG